MYATQRTSSSTIIIIIIINLLSKALQDAILHCLSAFSSMVYIEMKRPER